MKCPKINWPKECRTHHRTHNGKTKTIATCIYFFLLEWHEWVMYFNRGLACRKETGRVEQEDGEDKQERT